MWFNRKLDPSKRESEMALLLARKHLEEVKARGPEVQAVVEATVEFRRRNHFAEDLSSLLLKGATPK